MKQLLIVAALSASVFVSSCEQEPIIDENGFGSFFFAIMMSSYRPTYRGPCPTSRIVDPKDGTLHIYETPCYGSERLLTIAQRCPQGYAYADGRCTLPEEAVSDFQYCATANNACNNAYYKNTLNGLGDSEAYNTCDARTTGGHKWRTATYHEIFSLFCAANTVSAVPDLEDVWLWQSDADPYTSTSGTILKYTKISDRPQVFRSARLKTERHGVLCVMADSAVDRYYR